jgi:hypothetical protein
MASDEGTGGCKKVTTEFEIDRAEYMAFNEAILRSTVGLAVNNNRGIGTGTLVSYRERTFAFTAEHVIRDVDLQEIRYFVPPSTPLIEHSMRDGLPQKFELAYAGDCFKVDGNAIIDRGNDLAAIPLVPSPLMPSYMQFVPIENCLEAINDGASVLLVGFPVDNSTVVSGMNKALGLTSEHAVFSRSLQTQLTLRSSYDPSRHFLIDYSRINDGITPYGFSGAAAWCSRPSGSPIWAAKPIFAGIINGWVEKTAHNPDLLQGTQGAFVKQWFEQNS